MLGLGRGGGCVGPGNRRLMHQALDKDADVLGRGHDGLGTRRQIHQAWYKEEKCRARNKEASLLGQGGRGTGLGTRRNVPQDWYNEAETSGQE